jgi:hypothetical protein
MISAQAAVAAGLVTHKADKLLVRKCGGTMLYPLSAWVNEALRVWNPCAHDTTQTDWG